ncbi:spore cortex biosynthesis protein YabQ [Clostridium sp. AF18-27]|uniref:spore cortex biosynthesis protein YabQ n=1 Tax=Enterocloster lavalensis TaxID=460384 RepID=UPI000E480D27|nr:spore cortex biosynthesis protein YabQ [Enterocloster lavalensis]MBS5604066.1 spore cortex biosynthesis protein YabQ [Enterocloster asparagiformis]MCB6342517.1 spore cortex biosynthesis protein YabQ [Enterocloster lavalensis]RHR45086.1 spore cortex biosynthesis protein YabQ [Clostridium sp. AF18-27]
MSGVIRYEAWLLMLSLATGGWLMLVYDTLRVFRLMIRHSAFAVGLEDFFYWIGAGVVTFNLLYQQNDGGLRAYVIGGVLGGMILYDRLISRIFFKGLKKLGKKFTIKSGKNTRKVTGKEQTEKVGD